MSRILLTLLFFSLALPRAGMGFTIAEKKASFGRPESELNQEMEEQLTYVNESLAEKRHALKLLYEQALKLHATHANATRFQSLLEEINIKKQEIEQIQAMWRDEASASMPHDSYALMHQPDTTLLQLVIDYGAPDAVFLVPPEIGAVRLSINSNLPVPRECWGETLELILAGQGVGIRTLNPYLKELYILKQHPSHLKTITSEVAELEILPSTARVCFVLATEHAEPRTTLGFLQKFSNPNTTLLQFIGGQIFIISDVATVKELLKLYDFVKKGSGTREYQLVTLSKIDAHEMVMILESAFGGHNRTEEENNVLKVLPLTQLRQSLFLFGSKQEIARAKKLIRDVEAQVENPQEKTVFWYTVKHSDAEDLATVLARVYDLLVSGQGGLSDTEIAKAAETVKKEGTLFVSPAAVGQSKERKAHKTADGQNNFIVDAKTGAIIMVVEQEALPKIKELLKRLDVPKKMVQLEVLLFEKQMTNTNKSGLNLLRVGQGASKTNSGGLSWNKVGSGILEFLISRSASSGIPAYDLAYNFLIGQENVQINSSPSVTTVNQTPATIALVDEISINTGTSTDSKRDAFDRRQYGITIQITPTIHAEGDEVQFVTLDTDITFDTTKKSHGDRPDVTRRNIKNHVRIADGQTVILGGLRHKSTEDSKESIPFLGEIPGIGKLFGTSDMSDNTKEMFIFITPKIINDPIEDTEKVKREELKKRPGDIPELIHALSNAKEKQKKRLFEGSLTTLFGRYGAQTSPIRETPKEYDGR